MRQEAEEKDRSSFESSGQLERRVIGDWSQEFPDRIGVYWFYGYRYGKISCGREYKPELMLVTVKKIITGFIYVADGQFMGKDEVEEAHFLKAILPNTPNL